MSHSINFADDVIETTVTKRAEVVIDWIKRINRYRGEYEEIVVGLDIEWKPSLIRGRMTNKTAILQLCVGTRCLIIQLFYIDYIPRSLINFMRNRYNVFVGVEVDRDVGKLNTDYGLDCPNTADVRDLAISRYPDLFSNPRPGLKEIASEILGFSMVKPMEVTRSDWDKRVLSGSQVKYATIDAYASYALGNMLIKEGPESDPEPRSRSPSPYRYRSRSRSGFRSPYRYPSRSHTDPQSDVESDPDSRSGSPNRSRSPYRNRSRSRSPHRYRSHYISRSPPLSRSRSPSRLRSPSPSPSPSR